MEIWLECQNCRQVDQQIFALASLTTQRNIYLLMKWKHFEEKCNKKNKETMPDQSDGQCLSHMISRVTKFFKHEIIEIFQLHVTMYNTQIMA